MRLNRFEVFLASVVSRFPALKRALKLLYYQVFSFGQRHAARYSTKLQLHVIDYRENSFFGYFDSSPDNGNGMLLVMGFDGAAHQMPKPSDKLSVAVKKINSSSTIFETETTSFNWQQGCRAQWVNKHQFIFNKANNPHVIHNAIMVDLGNPQKPTVFNWPIETAYRDSYYLSVNYRRLSAAHPEYGYHDLPPLSERELDNHSSDGIRKVDIKAKESELIVPISRVVSDSKNRVGKVIHSLNHCSISPTGEDFLFIHRYFVGSKRVDNLFCYNLRSDILKPLCLDRMVSHYSWIDDRNFLCFFQPEGKRSGYYIVNKDTARCKVVSNETLQAFGDGHPSCHGRIIYTDCYPGRDRQQHLIKHDLDAQRTTVIGSFLSPLKYFAEGRCDLHPRLSVDGRKLFFDSVHQGNRKLCYVDLYNH